LNKKINIEWTQDTSDCETCGMSWADGGKIYIDGKMVDEVEPVAYCFGGTSAGEDELLVLALAHIGISVEVDGEKYHIGCVEISESRDKALEACDG